MLCVLVTLRHHVRTCIIHCVYPRTNIPVIDVALKAGTYDGSMVKSIPLQRWGSPEEIAEGVVFLCSAKASFITGEELIIDGGSLATCVS
jgi:meso-butanediol dehydrogenase/(S,S)-butanediol dehydrogenase/diacetyl reductase